MYKVYILECNKGGSFYCGITNDLSARIKAHNSGKGSKFVWSRGGGELVYSEALPSRGKALTREAEIKKMSRKQKAFLISHNHNDIDF
jgi:putative endonuclease